MNLLKRFYQYLSRKLENKSLDRYYTSIEEMPVHNWWKLHEKNDFKQLLKNRKHKLTSRKEDVLDLLQNEFIEVFGIDENYSRYLKKQIEIELLKIKIAKTGDKSHQIFIDMLEVELEDVTKREEGKNLRNNTIAIEKYMGFKLTAKEVTVYEYYSYVKALEKALKTK